MTAAEQNTLVETLREQINTLQAEVDRTTEALEALRAAHADDEDMTTAAEIDRQALVKARADLEAMEAEMAAQKAARAAELDAAAVKIEETANKLSELEVEVMELREAHELAKEERKVSETRINSLREEAQNAVEATNKAVQEAATKEVVAAEHLEEVKRQHTETLALAAEESRRLSEQLNVLQAEIDGLRGDLEAVNATAVSASEEHARQLVEAEKAHQSRQDELTAEIRRISSELEVRGMAGLLALLQCP
jgi:conserved oligomeric Golgi complex subunit 6